MKKKWKNYIIFRQDLYWLDYRSNIKGEFAVVYFGINNYLNNKDLMIKRLNDYSRNIQKAFKNKLYQNEMNLREYDLKCGEGLFLFQNPEYAEYNTGIIDNYVYRIKVILMCRVNPKKNQTTRKFSRMLDIKSYT